MLLKAAQAQEGGIQASRVRMRKNAKGIWAEPQRCLLARSTHEGRKGQIWPYLPIFFWPIWQMSEFFCKFRKQFCNNSARQQNISIFWNCPLNSDKIPSTLSIQMQTMLQIMIQKTKKCKKILTRFAEILRSERCKNMMSYRSRQELSNECLLANYAIRLRYSRERALQSLLIPTSLPTYPQGS